MKSQKLELTGAFCLTLALCGLLLFTLPTRPFSSQENRYLAALPAFNIPDLLSGKWQQALSDYACDQFPLREKLVTASADLRALEGKRDIGGAYLGQDGYYFAKTTGADIDRERFRRNLKYIRRFAAEHASVPTRVLLVPSAATVMPEKLPPFARVYDTGRLYETAARVLAQCRIIDCRGLLTAAKDQYVYYRTDHHWTTRGAYLAYTAYCADAGLPARAETDFHFQTVSRDFLGTLYSKALKRIGEADSIRLAPLPDTVRTTADGKDASVYAMKALGEKDKYCVFFGGNPGLVTIKNPSVATDSTLLIVKDSFANCFAPLLINDYRRIVMVDLRAYDGSVSALAKDATDILFLYEMSNFAGDDNLVKLMMN